jgi:PAS domain-containing protein
MGVDAWSDWAGSAPRYDIDITDQKLAEEALHQALERERQALDVGGRA